MKKNLYSIFLMMTAIVLSLTSCSEDEVTKTPLSPTSISEGAKTVSTLAFSWTPVDGATQYAYELKDEAEDVVLGGTTSTTSILATGLKVHTTYTLYVWAYAALSSDKTTSPIATLTATTNDVVQLLAPQATWEQTSAGIVLTWPAVENADYYEIEFQGMLYSTIRDNAFTFDGLQPETSYHFKVRAVNADGYSDWAAVNATTKANPLEFALKNIKAQTTCENQPGNDVNFLFDFDLKTMWHSKWGTGSAIPADMIVDLRAVSQLDRLEYSPREDGSNGTLTKGSISVSTDRQTWSEPVAFEWKADGSVKTFAFEAHPAARYLRIHLDAAVGNFASGREMYIFKVPGTESMMQGDINRDKRIDENDLTSYMNYTGLRKGDSDFDYVSIGDINGNGLIDAYDISCVTTELDGGVRNSNDKVSGSLVLTPNRKTFNAGDMVEITVSGKDLHYVNGLSFALPYDAQELEYVGTELLDMKEMVNLTNDRLHTSGQKALYPTFVNRGNNFLLEEGSHNLFVIKFRAKKAGKFTLKAQDGMLVDRNLGTAAF